jgi:predicted Zn-dependent peptidase
MPFRLNHKAEHSSYRKTVLHNGLRVVSERIPHVRSVSLGIWANVGSRDELPTENGISHFLEHMVFKGTRNRSTRDIAQSLESLGGYLNAFTTKEHTCFYARVLDANVPEALDVLADLVMNATFKPQEMEKEKLVVIEELRNAQDDPEDIIHDYFEKALFPEHSVGYPIIGTEENLRRFSRDDLRSRLGTHYTPSSLVISAAGNVEHERLVKLVEKHFRPLKLGARRPPRTPSPSDTVRGTTQEHERQIKQAHICLGTNAYSIRHKNRYPLLVLNAVLGEGMSSRLYQNIREKHGMAYSVYSFVSMLSDAGFFGTYIGTDKGNINRVIELVHGELNGLRSRRVPQAELARTKSQIKGTMMLGLENMSGRMIRLGSAELYFEHFMSLDSILRKIDAVTPEEIREVANDLFHPESFSTVVIRPA